MSTLLETIIETTILIGVFVGGAAILKTTLTPPQSVLTDSRHRKTIVRGGKTRKHKN